MLYCSFSFTKVIKRFPDFSKPCCSSFALKKINHNMFNFNETPIMKLLRTKHVMVQESKIWRTFVHPGSPRPIVLYLKKY